MAPDDGHHERPRGRWGGGPGRRWAEGRRPPWWPEGEPFPPQDREAWRGMRRQWARRAGCLFVLFVLLLVLLTGSVIWVLTTIIGGGLAALLLAVGWLAAVGVVASIGLARVRAALEPMGDLVEASERIEAGEVGIQVAVRGPREVRSVARAFNAMSTRLADDAERRRHLLADVSHELRTPLTIIGGSIEAMLDGLHRPDRPHLERLLAETRQMERLVEDLRTLALADAGALPLHREPVDLGRLAEEVVDGFRVQADDAGTDLRCSTDASLPEAQLDPVRLRQVVSNLVANALRHTPAGGTVAVTVRDEGEELVLEVADTGRGMDVDSAARAFDRFWRAGDSSGAGLGLSIVRDLVEAHGGTVELASVEGRGTTVRCRLPRTD